MNEKLRDYWSQLTHPGLANPKTITLMLALVFTMISAFQVQAIDTATRVSIEKQSVPLKEVLKEMEKQSKMRFFLQSSTRGCQADRVSSL